MKKKTVITTMILLVLLSRPLIGQRIQRIIIPDSTGTPWITNGNNIYYNSGNVGIGTLNPEHVLDVAGQTIIKASINSDMLDVVNDASANTVDAKNDLIWGRYTNVQNTNPGLIRFTTWADGYQREIFQVRNNGYMFLGNKSTGNYQFAFKVTVDNNLTRAISIYNTASGSSVPEFMVYGNGKVYCREVTITSGGWADNVFYPNYILPKLSEIEKYISEQGHLPGIPSEKEIINKGLNTGEMLKKQMQKIEELTLYTIEQEHKTEAQDEKIKMLEEKIEALSKLIKNSSN